MQKDSLFPSDADADPGDAAWSVSQFNRRVKELIEGAIPSCWVRGEVSNLRRQSSGHVYFSLKDESSQLSTVLFRGDALRQNVDLREGMEVVVYGNAGVYEVRGTYQLIARLVIESGAGRLRQQFEALKRKLAGEGLFDPEKKQPLPAMPEVIGFITSSTGAAIQDFIRILKRRGWSGRLIVLPAKVQGDGAAEEMIGMLEEAASLKYPDTGNTLIDLLVIGRGGGSLEDLWAFNEEALVRAVAACPLPMISAVGHEIDFTLCDFAADLRAETPSAAAEWISSGFVEHATRWEQARKDLIRAAIEGMEDRGNALDGLRDRLRLLSPAARLEQGYLRLDDLSNRLATSLGSIIANRRHRLQEAGARLRIASPETRVRIETQRLLGLHRRLQAASPASILNRGFTVVRDEQGTPVTRAGKLTAGQMVDITFADGTARSRVEEVNRR